ncbi:MAG: hypothetical protein ARM1_0496 [Candidatus Micrarchaeota archaeon]|nr:MAG: hypothetical protein ARM1_0496 [Candidatus Micrarchaeota archaeon]
MVSDKQSRHYMPLYLILVLALIVLILYYIESSPNVKYSNSGGLYSNNQSLNNSVNSSYNNKTELINESKRSVILYANITELKNNTFKLTAYLYNPSNTTVILYRNMSIITDIVSNTSFINNEYPCDLNLFPIVVALFKGNYSISQLYNKTPLLIEPPPPPYLLCPVSILSRVSYVSMPARSTDIEVNTTLTPTSQRLNYSENTKTTFYISEYFSPQSTSNLTSSQYYRAYKLNGSYTILVASPYVKDYRVFHIKA